ncbi:MAG TPA: hypothetical protein DDW52_12285 [Planctomycetaceae bacterium]|nr:hypothetical protein [Planctomycetaceae bacterium]
MLESQFLIALCVVTAGPWAASLLFRGRIEWVALGVVLVGTLFGPQFYSFHLGIGMSFDRLLLIAGCTLCAVRLIQGEVPVPKIRKSDIVLAVLCAWLMLSAVRAGSVPDGEPPTSRWMTFFLMPAILYALIRCGSLRQEDLNVLISAVIALGVYLGLTGVLEVAGLHALVFPRFIVDPNNWEFLGRARGPTLNPTGNGTILITAFAAALSRAVQRRQLEHTLYLIAAGVIGLGIVATLTRSVWLAGVLVVGTFAWFHARRYLPAAGLLAIAGVLLFSMIASQVDVLNIKRDKHLSAADAKKSVELRPVLAMVAWEMFKDKPLAGHGYGGYFAASPNYLTERSQDAPFEMVRPYMQHNVLLSLLVDSGIVAVALFCTWIGLAAFTAYRLYHFVGSTEDQKTIALTLIGCLVGYTINGMFHDVSVMPMMNVLLFFLVGLNLTVATSILPATAPVRAHVPHGKAISALPSQLQSGQ